MKSIQREFTSCLIMDKKTKKQKKKITFRIVKANQEDNTLNDCLWTGAPLTFEFTQVLFRFLLKQFVCLSDFRIAYLLVQLSEEF